MAPLELLALLGMAACTVLGGDEDNDVLAVVLLDIRAFFSLGDVTVRATDSLCRMKALAPIRGDSRREALVTEEARVLGLGGLCSAGTPNCNSEEDEKRSK
jgi:hypothetical protein